MTGGRLRTASLTGTACPGAGSLTLSLDEVVLDGGATLSPVEVAYQTYGQINQTGDNAILICHALTGSAQVSRTTPDDPRAGWWDDMVGPGRCFDTSRYFVISSNVLGGCYGTTGPSSINPATDSPYGMDFPALTIRDMVRLQHSLVRHLGIRRLKAVVGGSMGGMQALEWAIMYPDMVSSIIPIAASGRLSAQAIAYNQVQRLAIMQDPAWNAGDYYGTPGPTAGLGLARMIGTITYKSDSCWSERFGRAQTTRPTEQAFLSSQFEIENYLLYQGEKIAGLFDANTYLYLTRAMDLHDLAAGRGMYQQALETIICPVLAVGISSDILFPPYQQRELVQALRRAGREARYAEIESPYGHDAFLIETGCMSGVLGEFLSQSEG